MRYARALPWPPGDQSQAPRLHASHHVAIGCFHQQFVHRLLKACICVRVWLKVQTLPQGRYTISP
jgi:hypothetical protein